MQHPSVLHKILQLPIGHLAFTQDFKNRAINMGFHQIEQIISTPQAELEGRREYSESWMEELIAFAEQCEFIDQLDDNSRY